MYNQKIPVSQLNTCDLYFVIKSNNNKVDIEKIILDVDRNGNVVNAQQLKNIPVFTFKSGNNLFQFEVKEGDIGIYFNTKKYINSYLLNNQRKINPRITNFNLGSGFFLPIGMFNNFEGNGIKLESDMLTANITNTDLTTELNFNGNITQEGDITQSGNIDNTGDITSSGTITGNTLVSEDGKTQTITVLDLTTNTPITLNIENGIVK